MTHMSVTEARSGFAEIVNRAAYGHERIVITRRGKDIAAVVPAEDMDLLEELEDRMDIEAAEKALAESEELIPYEKVRRELGL